MILPSSDYSKFYLWAIACSAFIYIIVTFGLSGIPSLSRLALVSSFLLFFLLLLSIGKLEYPSWLLIILLFFVYLVLPAMALDKVPTDRLGTLTVAFVGAAALGLAIQNRMLSYEVVAYGTLAAAIINILSIHYGMGMEKDPGRFSGFMENPNALAIRMAFAGFLIWLIPERFSRSVRMLGIFIAVYGMYITGSRKGILMVAALLTLVFMDHIVRLSKEKVVLYASIIATFLFALYGVVSEFAAKYSTKIMAVNRMLEVFSGQDASFENRIVLIDTGLELWRKAPLFGYGIDQFSIISNIGSYSHNNYIELAVSGGAIAILLYYSMHTKILFQAMKQDYNFRLRLMFFVLMIVLMDMALVSYYDKAVICTLGVLLAVSSGQHQGSCKGSGFTGAVHSAESSQVANDNE